MIVEISISNCLSVTASLKPPLPCLVNRGAQGCAWKNTGCRSGILLVRHGINRSDVCSCDNARPMIWLYSR